MMECKHFDCTHTGFYGDKAEGYCAAHAEYRRTWIGGVRHADGQVMYGKYPIFWSDPMTYEEASDWIDVWLWGRHVTKYLSCGIRNTLE